MKKETKNSGLLELLNKRITLFCSNYIYTGKLTGINNQFVQLSQAAIVFETGSFTEKTWKDAQELPNSICIMLQTVEAFTVLK